MDVNKKEQKKKREEDAHEIQKMECRMYENKFPEKEELVMVWIFLYSFISLFLYSVLSKQQTKMEHMLNCSSTII